MEAEKNLPPQALSGGWRCLECGYLHTGDSPPEFCPECMAPGSVFQEVAAVEYRNL